MKQVQLVVTGDCEAKALHASLNRHFAGAIEFLRPIQMHSFTSK
jgi:hypothetical protein